MTDQKLSELGKEFLAKLRAHLDEATGDDTEAFVERLLGVGATLSAAAMMLLPAGKREKLIAALLSAALRHFATKPRARLNVDG